MTEEEIKNEPLIPLPELPPVPQIDKRTMITLGEEGEYITREVSIEEFNEWFDNPPIDELLYKDKKEGKDGKEIITYKIHPINFARALYNRFLPITYGKKKYIYSSEDRMYYEESGQLEAWVRNQIEDLSLKEYLPKSLRPDSIVREIVKQASGRVAISTDNPYPFNDYYGFPANNCVIRFNQDGTIEIEKFKRSMMFTRKSPINYNPEASTEKAEQILQSWLPGEDDQGRPMWEWLVQIPAQAVYQSLSGVTPFKYAYMLVGERDSGRSTYNEVMKDLFGENNVSTMDLQSLSDRFSLGSLVDKFMNFGDDIPMMRVKEGNKFKQLVGILKMSVEKKFQDIITARITAVHAYSANNLPHLDEDIYTDEAWWSRWAILKWNKRFPRDPMWKMNNLDTEFYEGFLLLVIGEVCKIIKNRGLTLTQDPDVVKIEWLGSETKLHEFIMVSVEYKDGAYIDSDCMFESLKLWANKHMPVPGVLYNDTAEQERWRIRQRSLLPSSKTALTQSLKKEGILLKQIKAKNPEDPNGPKISKYVYTNVKFRDFVAWAKYPNYIEAKE